MAEPNMMEHWINGVDKRLTSIEGKLDKALTQCATECPEKFAAKEAETIAKDLQRKYYIFMGICIALSGMIQFIKPIFAWLIKTI